MVPTTIDKETDRRFIPERRYYSYAKHIPERRGATTTSAFGKPMNTSMKGDAKKSEKAHDQNSKTKDVRPRTKPRPKTICLTKRFKTSKKSSKSLIKQLLLAKLKKSVSANVVFTLK